MVNKTHLFVHYLYKRLDSVDECSISCTHGRDSRTASSSSCTTTGVGGGVGEVVGVVGVVGVARVGVVEVW